MANMQHHPRYCHYVLQLSCKYGELKWNPCWVTVLMGSSGTNYLHTEHEDFDQYGPYAITSELMSCCSYESNWNPNSVIMLTSSSNTCFNNKHEYFDKYCPQATPSELMLQLSCKFSASKWNLHWVIVSWAYLAKIMSLSSLKILTNMAHMQYHPRLYNVTAIHQVWRFKRKSLLSYRVNELIWHELSPWHVWRFWPIWPICNIIQDYAMLQLSCKFDSSKLNPYWVTVLTSSSDTNYLLIKYEDFDQYGP